MNDEWDQYAESVDFIALGTDMIKHPYAQRHLGRYKATGDDRIRSPEDVLGERLVRVASMLIAEEKRPGWMVINCDADERRSRIVAIASIALTAPPYLWTEEVRAAIRSQGGSRKGPELPRHVISPRVLPGPRTWHTFETGITIGGVAEKDGVELNDFALDGFLVVDHVNGFNVVLFGDAAEVGSDERRPFLSGSTVRYGQTYPDDLTENELGICSNVLPFFAFLESPYIPKQRLRPSRAARREAQRNNADWTDDDVTFVILRRPAPAKGDQEPSGSVEWKHQWIVSGHMRAQWYPSEQAHRLIWIAPYLKGPEDAPMLEHAYKVAR